MCASPINDQGLKSKPCDGTLQASMHRFGHLAPERPLCADIVEKVENRTASRISRNSLFSGLDHCNAP
jgi:hypothetical protein